MLYLVVSVFLNDSPVLAAGTFVLSNLGMFGVDRFDAILPPGIVSALFLTVVAMYRTM